MNPLDIQRVALWWGPGILVLIVFSLGFFRLAQYWIEKSMEVKRQQLDGAYGLVRRYIEQFLGAQSGQANALSRLANSVEHRESQESFEHQEMLIALKALHGDIDNLRCRNSDSRCAISALAAFPGRSSSSADRVFIRCLGRQWGFPPTQRKVNRGESTSRVRRRRPLKAPPLQRRASLILTPIIHSEELTNYGRHHSS